MSSNSRGGRLIAEETVSLALAALSLIAYIIGFGNMSGRGICILLALIVAFSYNGARIHIKGNPGKQQKTMKILLAFYMAVYLHLLFSFTLGSTYFYRPSSFAFSDREQFAVYLQHRTNFVPFRTIADAFGDGFKSYGFGYLLVNVGGNILATMPLGIFLPVFFRAQRRFPVFLLTVSLLIAAIESLQMLTLAGACDIDDLILNDLGAALMFFIMRIPSAQKIAGKIFPGIWPVRTEKS